MQLDVDSMRDFFQWWEWGCGDIIPYGIYAVELNCVPQEVSFMLRELVEVESSSDWVSIIEVNGKILKISLIID